MTDYYLRSVGGSDSNDGLSWATARATIVSAVSLMVAGDTLHVAEDHVESTNQNRTLNFLGTPAQPNRVICCKAGLQPPTELAATASIVAIVGGGMTIQGSVIWHGVNMSIGTGGSGPSIILMSGITTDAVQIYRSCDFGFGGTSGSSLSIGNGGSSNTSRCRILLEDFRLKLNGSGQQIAIQQEFTWRGGKYVAGAGPAPSYLLRVGAQGRGVPVLVEGVDLSELAATTDLVNGPQTTGRVIFRDCLLPANWTGQLVQGVLDPGTRVTMHNCDSGATRYRAWVVGFTGALRSDSAFLKAGGANDGTASYSWRMDTNANAMSGGIGFESDEQLFGIPAAGVPMTLSIDVLTDGVDLTDADVWLDVQEAGAPKGSFYRSRAALLAVPKTHPASTATWATTGMASPRRQRVSVTFTPQTAGVGFWKLTLARPNTTIYVDPKRAV